MAEPGRASSRTDVQVLQTASSIEVLAVITYKTAPGLPYEPVWIAEKTTAAIAEAAAVVAALGGIGRPGSRPRR